MKKKGNVQDTDKKKKEKRKRGRGYNFIFSFRGFVNGTSDHEDICETLKALSKF